MSPRLIFDASAVAAFGLHETVGEIIGELHSQAESFGVTTASLAEAVAIGADPRLIQILQTHSDCAVFTSTIDWSALGRFLDMTRPSVQSIHDVADADLTMLAMRSDAFILTDRPERYTRIMPTVVTIPLRPPWPD
jgi:hypothetical protein